MYNNNLNNTLHEDANVSIKEFLADVNNFLLSDEEASLICFFHSCGIRFSFLQLILAHQNFASVCNPHCGRHCITAAVRLYLCWLSRQGHRRLYTFSLSLLRQKQRLKETRTRNHSHRTPTRTTLCLAQHLYPRALPAQHPQRLFPRLWQENGQVPQIVMLVIRRKNTNHRLPHPLYVHSRA